ncbi:MAG: PA domain-containing protein, partial [Acidobacteriota bacterium]
PFADDIIAFFNPNLGQPNCLAGSAWYYGLDNNAPAGTIDFLNVVLHEFGHGLGFASFADDNGEQTFGLPDIYGVYSRDNTLDKQWNQMNDSERGASTVNTGNLVWNGPAVVNAAPGVLGPVEELKITAPSSIAGTVIQFGTANFGPAPTPGNFSGEVVLANDGIGVTSDGCEPFVNASAISGRIALIDRGTCAFTVKVKNAQNAGATAAIVVNNIAGGGPIGLGGSDSTIVIPSVGISLEQGNLIKSNLPGVSVALLQDPSRLAGADAAGNVRLYAPNPVAPGSSVSHWDTVATPNLLMEPFITSSLKGATTLDLTPSQMTDIGWSGNLSCPVNSDDSAVVQIGSCNTGVENDFGPFTFIPSGGSGQVFGGCTVSDIVNSCDDTSCLAQATSSLRSADVITEEEKEAIMNCSGSL